ncbi:macro domain-containing protein [Aspergillus lucknowensis]|uniref:Macro domain-containing protein n=1 Tax=Aspergillus lucknowensis TaxID=176173 RepID=A0ABR4L9F7_9EURO
MAPPYIPLAEIPTVSLLYKLKRLIPSHQPANSPSKTLNDTISLVRNDITKLEGVDCIVNAANERLLGGGGVDGVIHRAAGRGLLEECRALNGCDTGDAKITSAYNLPCKRVIHAVGPIYYYEKRITEDGPEKLLRSCYRRSLELAIENDLKSIAFAAISTGVYGYPSKEAARAALDETRRFLESSNNIGRLERVIFCNFEAKDERAYEDLVPIFFPPVDEPQATGNEDSHKESPSPDVLAASLPNPPTVEPKLEGQPESKKLKVSSPDVGRDASTQTAYVSAVSEEKSEDEWEEVNKPDTGRTETLDDDPVEIGRPSSATDVQSVQSSGIIDDMAHSQSTDGFLDRSVP